MTRPAAATRLSELDFRLQVVGPKGLATILGWLHVGIRPAQTQHGWRTPTTGELGKGWPDLTLIHVGHRRALFVELKAQDGKVSTEQDSVLATLRMAGQEAYVWRPSDLDSGEIVRILR